MADDFDDLLLAELLGEANKAFEVQKKKSYYLISLEPGFEAQEEALTGDLIILAADHQREASIQAAENLFDIQSMTRPLVLRLRTAEGFTTKSAECLLRLSLVVEGALKTFVVAPDGCLPGSFALPSASELKTVLTMSGLVGKHSADPEIASACCKSLKELFEIQLKIPAKFTGGILNKSSREHPKSFGGFLPMGGGGVSIALHVIVEETLMTASLNSLAGNAGGQFSTEVFQNVPYEFVNIIAGSVRAKLNASGYSFRSLDLPILVTPESRMNFVAPPGASTIEVQLSTDYGFAWLEIQFLN